MASVPDSWRLLIKLAIWIAICEDMKSVAFTRKSLTFSGVFSASWEFSINFEIKVSTAQFSSVALFFSSGISALFLSSNERFEDGCFPLMYSSYVYPLGT